MKTAWGQENLHEIISCTTRPPRDGEIDGVHYHFIPTAAEFFGTEHLMDWLEMTTFRSWFYGTSKKDLDENKINIGIFNVAGVESLLKLPTCEVLPVYIHTYGKLRLIRQLTREENPDCVEICRRYVSDEKDFLNINFAYKVIENNTDEMQHILEDLQYCVENFEGLKEINILL